jgi:hypothetical protein
VSEFARRHADESDPDEDRQQKPHVNPMSPLLRATVDHA